MINSMLIVAILASANSLVVLVLILSYVLLNGIDMLKYIKKFNLVDTLGDLIACDI